MPAAPGVNQLIEDVTEWATMVHETKPPNWEDHLRVKQSVDVASNYLDLTTEIKRLQGLLKESYDVIAGVNKIQADNFIEAMVVMEHKLEGEFSDPQS